VFRFRWLLPGMFSTALCLLVAFAAASASAAGCEESGGKKCLWVINGTRLEKGMEAKLETKTKVEENTKLKGKASGAEVELEGTEVEDIGGVLLGGIPGKDEVSSILFKNVSVKKPTKCEVASKEVRTKPLISELVEFVKGGTPQKTVAHLFLPKTAGEPFAEFELKNKGTETCSLNGVKVKVEGKQLATLILQEGSGGHANEILMLLFKKGEDEYRTKGSSTTETAELKVSGEAATFSGRVGLLLAGGGTIEMD
jgi:hypothetical protein